jgi:hypothetical protein
MAQAAELLDTLSSKYQVLERVAAQDRGVHYTLCCDVLEGELLTAKSFCDFGRVNRCD